MRAERLDLCRALLALGVAGLGVAASALPGFEAPGLMVASLATAYATLPAAAFAIAIGDGPASPRES
jgi:hypothetical protein